MPRYFKSTANKPGGGVRKGYRRGGRNLRDEEARVIGVQDNAADELRRVRARRPHDAAERRDKRSQLSRVGSRERNARDEMRRLRGEAVGFQYGGRIGRQAAAMGPAIAAGIPHGDDPGQRYRSLQHYLGNRRGVRGMQYGGAIGRQAAALGPSIAAGIPHGEGVPGNRPNYRSLQHYLGNRRARGFQYGGAIGRQAAAMGPSIAAGIPHGDDPSQGYRSLQHYLGNRGARGYQAGGEIAPDMSEVDRRIAELEELAIAQQLPMYGEYGEPVADHRGIDRTMGYIPPHPEDRRSSSDRLMQRGYQAGGRVGFKKGGRISRKKKGAKFI